MNIVSIMSSTAYRMSVLVSTCIITILIFYLSLDNRPVRDPVPDIKPITPELYRQWGQYANVIDFGLYIRNVVVLDFRESKFSIDAFVWMVFNSDVVSMKTAGDFVFDKGIILEKRLLDSKRMNDKLFLRYFVRVEFNSPMSYRDYPFDSHNVYLTMKIDEVAPWEIMLRSTFTRTLFAPSALTLNWKVSNSPEVQYGYFKAELDARDTNNIDYSSVAGTYFSFMRKDYREAIFIFIPLFILLFMVLSSLVMMLTSVQSVFITLLSMIAMILYRLIITSMLPTPIVTYYMLSDIFFLLVFLCVFIVFLAGLINALYDQKSEWWFDVVPGVALTLSSMVFLVGWFYLMYVW